MMEPPVLRAEFLYLGVGVATPNLNVRGEIGKLLLQEFELRAPLRTAFDEDVAVESRLGFQSKPCGAVEQRLWLWFGEIGQQ